MFLEQKERGDEKKKKSVRNESQKLEVKKINKEGPDKRGNKKKNTGVADKTIRVYQKRGEKVIENEKSEAGGERDKVGGEKTQKKKKKILEKNNQKVRCCFLGRGKGGDFTYKSKRKRARAP